MQKRREEKHFLARAPYIEHNRNFQGGMDMAEEISLAEVPLRQNCRVEQTPQLRLMELGFSDGSWIQPLYSCFGGGTRVYGVKDTMIALRDTDAAQIFIRVVE